MKRTLAIFCTVGMLAAFGFQASKKTDNPKRIYQLHSLAKSTIKLGKTTIPVWVMDRESKRAEGMMWLTDKDVKPNEGMLFVFDRPQPLSFWMQNTILPLDIAFIAADGKVLNIQKGKSFDETSLPSKGDAMYVLEMKMDRMKPNGIVAGKKLIIPKSLKSVD